VNGTIFDKYSLNFELNLARLHITMNDTATNLEAIESPCILVCEIMPSGHCSGCYRSREEIGKWLMYSSSERQEIMSGLENRREQLLLADLD